MSVTGIEKEIRNYASSTYTKKGLFPPCSAQFPVLTETDLDASETL